MKPIVSSFQWVQFMKFIHTPFLHIKKPFPNDTKIVSFLFTKTVITAKFAIRPQF